MMFYCSFLSAPEDQKAHLSSVIEEIKTDKYNDQLGKNEALPSGDSFESSNELTNFNDHDFNNSNNTSDMEKYAAEALKTLSDDLSAFFGSDELSDLKVLLKSGEYLPCHKFILRIRCPDILRNPEYLNVMGGLDLSQYSIRATKAFFNYIYTGKIDTIYYMLSEDKNDLYVLAKKYSVEFLKEFMLAEFRSNSFLLYSQDTCSPPHTPPRVSQSSIQNISNVISSFHMESVNSPTVDEFRLPKNMQTQQLNLSCSDVQYPVDHETSVSGIQTSKIDYLDSPTDIFKSDIKSPYNNSLIFSPNVSQTKRKLIYSNNYKNESKKNRKDYLSNFTMKDIQKVIVLDSDSDDEYPIIKTNHNNQEQQPSCSGLNKTNISSSDLPLSQQPSCSGINKSKISSSDPPLSFLSDDDSSYDIFECDIKSPCNSSILLKKHSLNYSNMDRNELGEKRSDHLSNNTMNYVPEVMIDSDSDDKYPIQKFTIPPKIQVEEDYKQFTYDSIENHSINLNSTVSHNSVQVKSESTSDVKPDLFQLVPCSEQIRLSPLLITSPSSKIQKRSIDRYFEASFPDIGESICNIEVPSLKKNNQSTPPAPIVRNPSSSSTLTPLQEIIIHDATPKPDFNAMISPELKEQLKKYGLKPNLERRKARTLLRYIYEQIHPVVDDLPKYKASVASTSKQSTPLVVISDDDSSNCDQAEDELNSENDFAYEEYMFNCSKVQSENKHCPNDGSSLREIVIRFIRSDDELFTNVVLFNPLLLKKFYKTFKEHGVQCSMHDLMDVLDDLCVNYRVEQSEASLAKRNKRKPNRRRKK